MTRIPLVTADSADESQSKVLDLIKKKMGTVPNILATMVNSPAVAQAYLGFNQALAAGSLPAPLREQIAITVGQTNRCEYCLAAHAALGTRAGLSSRDVELARRASAEQPKAAAALAFARRVVEDRGKVTDEEVQDLRSIGYSNGEIAEIVANVALNIFTNYFNHLAETEVDFPLVPELVAS